MTPLGVTILLVALVYVTGIKNGAFGVFKRSPISFSHQSLPWYASWSIHKHSDYGDIPNRRRVFIKDKKPSIIAPSLCFMASTSNDNENKAPGSMLFTSTCPFDPGRETTITLNEKLTNFTHASTKNKPVYPDESIIHFNERRSAHVESVPFSEGHAAENILFHMERLYNSSSFTYKHIRPDTITYTNAISAWANQRKTSLASKSQEYIKKYNNKNDAPQRAERLLRRMEVLSLSSFSQLYAHIKPNSKCYSMVLHCWANNNHACAPYQAEKVLNQMIFLAAQKHSNIAPGSRCFSAVIHAWSRRSGILPKQQGAARRADAVLKLAENYQQKSSRDICSTFTYSSVILAWSKTRLGGRDVVRRCEELIHRMEDLYKENPNGSVQPNSFSYTALLNVYANASSKKYAIKAENVLQKMEKLHRTGFNSNAKPNVYSYTAVVRAWARSVHNTEGASQRALSILEYMHNLSSGASEIGDKDKIFRHIKPLTMTYNACLEAFANQGDGKRAEKLLIKMERIGSTYASIQPNTQSINHVLQAWYNSNEADAADRAEEILLRYEKKSMESRTQNSGNKKKRFRDATPDLFSYNIVISLWAQSTRLTSNMVSTTAIKQPSGSAARRAEAILYRMMTSSHIPKPDKRTFCTVISAWSRCRDLGSAERAEQLLYQMEKVGIRPNVVAYSSVMDAWAKVASVHPVAGHRAEMLLNRMEKQYYDKLKSPAGKIYIKEQQQYRADTICYNAVVKAYAHSNELGSVERSEALIRRMESIYSKNKDSVYSLVKPNVRTMNSLLFAYCRAVSLSYSIHKINALKFAEKAECVLNKMEDIFVEQGNVDMKPDILTYSTVIAAWTRCNEKGSLQRAIKILDRMTFNIESETIFVLPDASTCFDPILKAVCKKKGRGEVLIPRNRLKMAMEVLDKMEDSYYLHNNTSAKPNTWVYSTVLNVCGKHDESKIKNNYNKRESSMSPSKKAHEVLDRMIKMSKHENVRNSNIPSKRKTKPTTIHYNIVLSAYSKSREKGAAQKCQELLDQMKLRSFIDFDVKPDIISYISVITAWSQSDSFNASQQTLALLKEIEELHNCTNISHDQKFDRNQNKNVVKMNTVCFNACLHSLARDEKKESTVRAEELLRRMEELHQTGNYDNVKPNVISYTTVINSWARLRGIKEAPYRAEKLLLYMDELYRSDHIGWKNLKPDTVVFNTVLEAWSCSGNPEAPQKMQALLEYMIKTSENGEDLKPDKFSFHLVLKAWTKEKNPKMTQNVLDEMERTHGGV